MPWNDTYRMHNIGCTIWCHAPPIRILNWKVCTSKVSYHPYYPWLGFLEICAVLLDPISFWIIHAQTPESLTPTPAQCVDSDSSCQKGVDSDSDSNSSCQKRVDSDSDSDSNVTKNWVDSRLDSDSGVGIAHLWFLPFCRSAGLAEGPINIQFWWQKGLRSWIGLHSKWHTRQTMLNITGFGCICDGMMDPKKSGNASSVNCNWDKQATNSLWHDSARTVAIYKQFNEVSGAYWRGVCDWLLIIPDSSLWILILHHISQGQIQDFSWLIFLCPIF